MMTYYYAQKHHKNYNIMLQELSDESRRMSLKMNIAKTKVVVRLEQSHSFIDSFDNHSTDPHRVDIAGLQGMQ